jgi:hypothetical protein
MNSANCEAKMTIGKALISAISFPGLKDLAEGTLEAVLDGALKEGFYRDVPIIGSLAAIAKAGLTVRDRLLARKIERFLDQVANLSASERARVVSELAGTQEKQEHLGEVVLDLLDKADPIEKPAIIGRLFTAMGRKKIPPADFFRLSAMINGVFLGDLRLLAGENGVEEVEEARRFALQANGFLLSEIDQIYAGGGGTMKWSVTADGLTILQYLKSCPV